MFFSEKLGRYTILRELEKGGMASVDLALRDGARELCVIKRLHQQDWSKTNVLKRFHREAKLASLLDHPNLARVLDAGLEAGVFCLVAEYVAGKTLAAFRAALARKNQLIAPELTVWIGMEALAALEHVHAAKDATGQPLDMIHRDVSARNVMIGFSGDVKLIDFGLAKASIDDFETAHGTLLGTFPYLSPEQAAGEAVDGRSDLYSLSVILFETLSGQALIARTQPAEMLEKILHEPAPPHSAFPHGVPAAVRSAVIRGLAKDPARRWGSAREYREALGAGIEPWDGAELRRQLATAVAELYPADAEQTARLIAFYRAGGDGMATALAANRVVELIEVAATKVSAPPEDEPVSETVQLPGPARSGRVARQVAIGLALIGVGWAVGWLLLPRI